ncbi:protein prenylyltransferase [Hypoxylon trugodes]|uniref:protein prenylyltransferase n=1 Tax=Hypoxylon trugodes TaxID=326681 RepID=UPI00218E3347|nr:protein prenylyltransferase [Hypoxylon trugodes]KAI1382886.1 protein prenylyltransferase [Hypoxylon trugodes]
MDSHGAARTSRTARTEEHRKRDLDKIKKYRELEESIRGQVSTNNYDTTLFQLTSKLLRLNPEYYTIWNVRRRCLISGLFSAPSDGSSLSRALPSISQSDTTNPSSDHSSPSSSDATPRDRDPPTTGQSGTSLDGKGEKDVEADAGVLQSEMAFIIPLLLEFPKCYWVWKYRRWLLEQANIRLPATNARKFWEAELALTSKMLAKDQRNFHAWGYRRYVVASLESPSLGGRSMVEDEFAYTTRKISTDLSNFSAWHNRSQLLLRLLEERGADHIARKEFLQEELSNILEALNVGPEDQSLWYYHQYLISQIVNYSSQPTIAPALAIDERLTFIAKEIDNIKDLLEDYGDTKRIYEALLEYTIALKGLGNGSTQIEDPTEWLTKVRTLDPMRAGRWDDVEKQLSTNQH